MRLQNERASIFFPGGSDERQGQHERLVRTTHLGIGAHPDDLEILAIHGILHCAASDGETFSGVVASDGTGGAYQGRFAELGEREMAHVRRAEQRRAASAGDYGAAVFLGYQSAELKSADYAPAVENDLLQVLAACSPEVVYTHNLCDQHDTHVAVALRTIEALRRLPAEVRPKQVWGCEVWRDLDWMLDDDKVSLGVGEKRELQQLLLSFYESQHQGAKRYDQAALGRRAAHATFGTSHADCSAGGIAYAMDLVPLMDDSGLAAQDFVQGFVKRFAADVQQRLSRVGSKLR